MCLGNRLTLGVIPFGYYYVSKKQDGVLTDFTVVGFPAGGMREYCADSEIPFVSITLSGDANGDGEINGNDLTRLRKALLSPDGAASEPLDVNGDNAVTLLVLIRLKKVLAGRVDRQKNKPQRAEDTVWAVPARFA